jgi:hypothetical protein
MQDVQPVLEIQRLVRRILLNDRRDLAIQPVALSPVGTQDMYRRAVLPRNLIDCGRRYIQPSRDVGEEGEDPTATPGPHLEISLRAPRREHVTHVA